METTRKPEFGNHRTMFTTANGSTVCVPFPVTDLEPFVEPVV